MLDDIEIKGLSYDSRKVKPGDIFVAIPGTKTDGSKYIPQAVEKGARIIISEKAVKVPEGVKNILVPSARRALAELANRFYNYPSKKLNLIGITGTNGKTTIAYLLDAILRKAGYKVGMITTVEVKIDGRSHPSELTTPGPLELQKMLSEMLEKGVTHVVMEVSSHALDQERVYGCEFDMAIYTNLTHDHLDYHKSMEEYLKAKLKLFEGLGKGSKKNAVAIINVDDRYSSRLIEAVEGEVVVYGIKDAKHEPRNTKTSDFDVRIKDVSWDIDEMSIKVDAGEIRSSLIGLYNVYNILAAYQAALLLKIKPSIAKNAIQETKVPGRFELIGAKKGQFKVVVDFAHTPDALEKLLGVVRPLTKGRLILVFGCPGDRDRDKRPLMGKMAAELADSVIVTTDDPHTEEPKRIIGDILNGVTGNEERVTRNIDRKKAIEKAVKMAKAGDVVVVAGRGHERYQDFNGKKIEIDDREVVRKLLG